MDAHWYSTNACRSSSSSARSGSSSYDAQLHTQILPMHADTVIDNCYCYCYSCSPATAAATAHEATDAAAAAPPAWYMTSSWVGSGLARLTSSSRPPPPACAEAHVARWQALALALSFESAWAAAVVAAASTATAGGDVTAAAVERPMEVVVVMVVAVVAVVLGLSSTGLRMLSILCAGPGPGSRALVGPQLRLSADQAPPDRDQEHSPGTTAGLHHTHTTYSFRNVFSIFLWQVSCWYHACHGTQHLHDTIAVHTICWYCTAVLTSTSRGQASGRHLWLPT